MSFTVREIKISISFFFFFAAAFLFLARLDSTVYLTLGGAVLHELGHTAVMVLLGGKPSEVDIRAFGARIKTGGKDLSYKGEIAVAAAGPAVSFLLWAVFWAAFLHGGKEIYMSCALVNLALALFNLLPIADLDGGRILENFLMLFFSQKTVYAVCLAVSAVFLLPVGFAGFYMLINGYFDFSALAVFFYLIFLVIHKTSH